MMPEEKQVIQRIIKNNKSKDLYNGDVIILTGEDDVPTEAKQLSAQTIDQFQGATHHEGKLIFDMTRCFGGAQMIYTASSRPTSILDFHIYIPFKGWRPSAYDMRNMRRAPSTIHQQLCKKVFNGFLKREKEFMDLTMNQFRDSSYHPSADPRGRPVGNFNVDVAVCQNMIPVFAIEVCVGHAVSQKKHDTLMKELKYGYIEMVYNQKSKTVTWKKFFKNEEKQTSNSVFSIDNECDLDASAYEYETNIDNEVTWPDMSIDVEIDCNENCDDEYILKHV